MESEQNSRKRGHYDTNLRWSAIRTGTTISDSADRGSKPHELSWIKALTEKSDYLALRCLRCCSEGGDASGGSGLSVTAAEESS